MFVSPQVLMRLDRAVPRYTSYPTAVQFHSMDESVYKEHLSKIGAEPISLYIHVPFCRSMCLFCGCSVVLNRRPEHQSAYVEDLLQEIRLVAELVKKAPVSQLHFGGGTPTSLNSAEFEQIFSLLRSSFDFTEGAELSIEIDPRTVYADGGEKLRLLRRLGCNRVSFGVQDLDPKVQEAVKRRQSKEMSLQTFEMARSLGFEGINLDLIYGLPFQTVESFTKTVVEISSWKPDRIALFSYAKVPWLKKHQQAIPEETLPTTEEKFAIYAQARSLFLAHGYTAIGMDHFSLSEDSLSLGYREGKLYRNFQGYSLHLANHMIGLGVSSVGFVGGAYFQNTKQLEQYAQCVKDRLLPVSRGVLLSDEDRLRHWVIQELMCRFEVDKKKCEQLFGIDFEEHFQKAPLQPLKDEGLLEETSDRLLATPLGHLFIRLIASAFDGYLTESSTYSKLI